MPRFNENGYDCDWGGNLEKRDEGERGDSREFDRKRVKILYIASYIP